MSKKFLKSIELSFELSINKICCQIYRISHNELKFEKLKAHSLVK